MDVSKIKFYGLGRSFLDDCIVIEMEFEGISHISLFAPRYCN